MRMPWYKEHRKAVCGKIARRSLNLLITRCDWLETLMEYGFHGFFHKEKMAHEAKCVTGLRVIIQTP
jgi:hypothetical protein